MKRVLLWPIAALLTFSLGLGAWSYIRHSRRSAPANENLRNKSSQTSEIPAVPVVSICELARNPELYDRRIIRTKAVLSVGKDLRTLSDSKCSNTPIFGECFHPPEKTCEALSRSIDEFRGGKPG